MESKIKSKMKVRMKVSMDDRAEQSHHTDFGNCPMRGEKKAGRCFATCLVIFSDCAETLSVCVVG